MTDLADAAMDLEAQVSHLVSAHRRAQLQLREARERGARATKALERIVLVIKPHSGTRLVAEIRMIAEQGLRERGTQ